MLAYLSRSSRPGESRRELPVRPSRNEPADASRSAKPGSLELRPQHVTGVFTTIIPRCKVICATRRRSEPATRVSTDTPHENESSFRLGPRSSRPGDAPAPPRVDPGRACRPVQRLRCGIGPPAGSSKINESGEPAGLSIQIGMAWSASAPATIAQPPIQRELLFRGIDRGVHHDGSTRLLFDRLAIDASRSRSRSIQRQPSASRRLELPHASAEGPEPGRDRSRPGRQPPSAESSSLDRPTPAHASSTIRVPTGRTRGSSSGPRAPAPVDSRSR